ncbi:DUF5067 domain-containing protein [Listeria swaminathanii]|uniref:DUF5067 domain-containing protein n=1 Tax=Listeria swaminathanii TaxID=2713501 RepID=A0A7X0ZYM4_9LIST|nr:DUF5067 domain-containing protein [Listeria swaminathanii]MBC2328787.1 DUF5067 domain-containing protein [Listeria swaminathanii]MDT0015930.1 DUF5067 domain-containing protein [Listeria swaminathanii]MDT0021366.1 DUF5067 domain-containing protein [Listeria swaminathanii]MDT0032330.1 DUF5067 domain-containing protein [Listeria swaminathanii]MDT0051820.1 DUF5067 domain-containing protein [Listeria swaminathanii]
MKKLKSVLLLMGIITFALALTACGGTEDKASTDKKETAKAETKKKADSNELGDYKVEILSSEVVKDLSGKDAIAVKTKFTNNSKENISFMVAIDQQAFQNGTQLTTTVAADGGLGGSEKDVQPGGSLEVTSTYTLQDTQNKVDVEAKELISFSKNSVKKSFELK